MKIKKQKMLIIATEDLKNHLDYFNKLERSKQLKNKLVNELSINIDIKKEIKI